MHAHGTHLILLFAAAGGPIALFSLFVSSRAIIKARAASKRGAGYARLEGEVAILKESLAASSARADEQARHIAWLESRLRPGARQAITDEPREIAVATNEPPSITERRHRILSLAKRGLDVDAISAALGEMHGEIELIINMGAPARQNHGVQ
ncbi:MAG TPA: hypothetical protein VLZ81_18275 [Blastocatellia bacterium]|nr:hypothetical protein [Blastocatellia bacterium]